MTETDLAKPSPATLALAQAETTERIAWCREKIAEFGYSPLPTPHAWAGRDDMVARLSAEFDMDRLDAAQVVDIAANEYWSPTVPEDKSVAKRLSRQRLMLVRKWIINALNNGRRDIQYHWEKDPLDPDGEPKKVPFKEKVYFETSAAMLGLLIQVDSTIMKLDGLDGVESGDGAATIMEELEKVIDEADAESPGIRRKVKMSLVQRIKTQSIDDLTVDGVRRMVAAFDEKAGKKTVKAKVVE